LRRREIDPGGDTASLRRILIGRACPGFRAATCRGGGNGLRLAAQNGYSSMQSHGVEATNALANSSLFARRLFPHAAKFFRIWLNSFKSTISIHALEPRGAPVSARAQFCLSNLKLK